MIFRIVLMCFIIALCQIIMAQALPSNHVLVINTYNKKGTPEKATAYYKNNIAPNEINEFLELAIGKNFYLLGSYKEAANIFIEINKANNKLANYELAQCYACMGKPDLAVKYMQEHLNSKDRKMQRTIKSDKAFSNIEKSQAWIDLWRNDWYSKYDIMLEEAWFEYEHEKYEEALIIINKLNNIRKSLVDAYYLKCMVYMKLGEPQNALNAINTAIEKRPKIDRYYAAKANVEIELNKAKKALKSIAIAIEMDSSEIDYYFIRSKAYLKSGKLDMANKDLDALISLVPDFDVYKLAGSIYSQAGEYQSALKAYNKCIALNEYDAEVYIERANVYQKVNAYEFAEKDYSMALDFQPSNGELYYKRGLARKHQHKADLACSDFNKAFKFKYMKADDEIRAYCQGR